MKFLFLQGGASLGFLISAYNMMRENKNGGYLVTGSCKAKKAAKEASFMGSSTIIASSEDKKLQLHTKKLHYRFKPRLFSLYIKQYNFWNSS